MNLDQPATISQGELQNLLAEIERLRMENNRNTFMRDALLALSYQDIIELATACKFPVIDPSSYLTASNARTTIGYATTIQQPLPVDADLTLSEFKRAHMMIPPVVKSVRYGLDMLLNSIAKYLFAGEIARARAVVQAVAEDLVLLRNALTYVCSNQPTGTVSETSQLQPIYIRFLEGILQRIGREDQTVGTAAFTIELRTTVIMNGEETPVLIAGRSDVVLYKPGADIGDVAGTAMVTELKPPYKQLYRSMAYKQKDQMIGQTLGLAQMQPRRKVVITALTDMFSLNLCLHIKGISYLTTRVVDPVQYATYLLFGMANVPVSECENLLKQNKDSIENELLCDDDMVPIVVDPAASGRTLRSSKRKLPTARDESAHGSKKRVPAKDSLDIYYDEQQALRQWYARAHGEVYMNSSALYQCGTSDYIQAVK